MDVRELLQQICKRSRFIVRGRTVMPGLSGNRTSQVLELYMDDFAVIQDLTALHTYAWSNLLLVGV